MESALSAKSTASGKSANPMAQYHILLTREKPGQPWCIEFGDFDRSTVVAERLSYRDSGYRASNLRIVAANSAHTSCVKYVVEFANRDVNQGVQPCPITESSLA